jgi:uncharacterized membrane protein
LKRCEFGRLNDLRKWGKKMLLENVSLRANARAQLKGNWGTPILIFFLIGLLITITSNIPVIGPIVALFITGSLMVGQFMFSLKFKRGEKPGVALLFEGFKYYGATLGLYLWYLLWVCLWSCLLIIPGFIKSISYMMCFYVMADNPRVGIKNALNISKKMTKGYKGKIFMLLLSFTGWLLLSILTLGIGLLWLIPYVLVSLSNLYDELKNESNLSV